MWQEQIDANKATLEKIQELVNAGAVVTSCKSDGDGGIILALSNGNEYHITKGETGAQGIQGEQGIQGPEGPIGPKGDVPTFSIVDGKLIATWSDKSTNDLGQVISEVKLPEMKFAIDENGNLTLNGDPLGQVVGTPVAVDFKVDEQGDLYKKIGDGEWEFLAHVKGEQGEQGIQGNDATMPSIKFDVNGKDLYVKIGDAEPVKVGAVGVGKDDFQFEVKDGRWILNGNDVGAAVTYPNVELTVVEDYLYLNGKKITPEIRVNQSIYVFDNDGVLTINVPKKDGAGYEGVEIPKMIDFTNLLNRIQSLVYVPEYSDGKATVYKFDELMSDISFEFLVTPNVLSEQIVALANEKDSKVVSMIMQEVLSRSTTLPALENIKVTSAEKVGRFVVRATPKNFEDGKSYSTALLLQSENDNRTSSFINIAAPKPLTATDLSVVKKTQEVGKSVELSDEIIYTNNAAVIDVLDVNTGIIEATKYVRDFNSVFSQEISYEIVGVQIGLGAELPYGTEVEKTAAIAALKVAGFVLTEDGDVKLTQEAVGDRSYINNQCTIKVKASTGETELVSSDYKIKIVAPATKADYGVVNDRKDNKGTPAFVWENGLEDAGNNIILNPAILYNEIEGITSEAELLTALGSDVTEAKFYVLEDGEYVEKTAQSALLMVNETHGIFIHLPAGESWKSYDLKTTFKLKGAEVELKAKVDFSYPDGTINTDKNPSMWLANGHMFISGKYDKATASEFNLAGPLSVGFAYIPTGNDGIKYEFEIIPTVGKPAQNPTGVTLTDKNTLKFATYTYNQVVKVKGYMVFGVGGDKEIREPLTNFAEFIVEPQSPIATEISVLNSATAIKRTYTKVMASNGDKINLAEFLSLKNDRGNELIVNGNFSTKATEFTTVLTDAKMYGLTTPTYKVKSVKVKGTSTERPLMIDNMVIEADGKFSTTNLGTGLAEDLEVEIEVSIDNNWSLFEAPAKSSPYASKGVITIFVEKTSN